MDGVRASRAEHAVEDGLADSCFDALAILASSSQAGTDDSFVLRAQSFPCQKADLAVAVAILNRMLDASRPDSVRHLNIDA